MSVPSVTTICCGRRESDPTAVIARYSTPEMSEIWSDVSKLRRWLEIELLATEAHAELGIVPVADAAACRDRAPVVDER